MPRKVTRYRDKATGQYISKAKYRANRARSLRQRERYVKGERRKLSELQKLLKSVAPTQTVIIRKVYKSKKQRKETHIEIEMKGGVIKKVRIGHREYTRQNDIKALRALLDAASLVSTSRKR
jgi:hypothetical protein